jgi:hypothetical protein
MISQEYQIKQAILEFCNSSRHSYFNAHQIITGTKIEVEKPIVETYLEEMEEDGALRLSSGGRLFTISSRGERILLEGGYLKIGKEMDDERKLQEQELEVAQAMEIKIERREKWKAISVYIAEAVALLSLIANIYVIFISDKN